MKKIRILFTLLAGTFLSRPTMALDITADYLNSLDSSGRMSWSEFNSSSGEGEPFNLVHIGEKTFTYQYSKPSGYSTETSTTYAGRGGNYDRALFTHCYQGILNDFYIEDPLPSDLFDINSDFYQNDYGFRNLNAGSANDVNGYFVENLMGIENTGSINNINSSFIGNYNETTGSALTNSGTVQNIVADYIIGNTAGLERSIGEQPADQSNTRFANGGAISGNVEGDITAKLIAANGAYAYNRAAGGFMAGDVNNLTADIIYNTADGDSAASGGAFSGSINGILKSENIVGNSAIGGNSAAGGFLSGYAKTINVQNITDNYAQAGNNASGGAISGTTGEITVTNIKNNYVKATDVASGGFFSGYAANLIADTISGNYAYSENSSAKGGFFNGNIYGDINAKTISGNYAKSENGDAFGGFMNGRAGNITGNFTGNYAEGGDRAYGGVFGNEQLISPIGVIYEIYDDDDEVAYTFGPAWNKDLGVYPTNFNNNTFEGNYAKAENYASGGVIRNVINLAAPQYDEYEEWASDYDQTPEEYYNRLVEEYPSDQYASSWQGAVENSGLPNVLTFNNTKFINNYAEGGDADGGAITNVLSVLASGIQNSDNGFDWQGAGAYAVTISDSVFEGNYVHSTGGKYALGGAIGNGFRLSADVVALNVDEDDIIKVSREYAEDIKSHSALNLINTSFTNNHVDSDDGYAMGGAIFSEGDVNIIAKDGKTSLFSGNTANGESNAIYMSAPQINMYDTTNVYRAEEKGKLAEDEPITLKYLKYKYLSNLNLSATDKGVVQFDDVIDGDGYNINISGDGTGIVKFNNLVKNVTNFTLGANSITHLGLNSKVYAQNMNIDSSAMIQTSASSSPIITVDVEVDKANNTVNAGSIHVDNDIEGEYRVLVNSLNSDVLDNTEDAVVPFLFAPNDDENTDSSFSVARVIGSPYLWEGPVNAEGETEGSTWYLNLTDEENPDYDDGSGDDPEPGPEPKPEPEPQPKPSKIYAPEVIAGIGLHEATIEQTRSVVHNVKGKVESGREFCPACGMYSYNWDGKKLRNIWALAQGESADIEKPIDMEAKIYAVEGGFDIQNDIHNTLGVFASYRTGEYDLSGKGKKFRSSIGSEIDIDSYLAGLYYRYDRYLVWAFATLYGGVQEADVKTDDGIAKFNTDGVEFGASIEVGRTIPLANDLTLDPSVGLYYTQVNFDDVDDNVGKHYEWDDIKHLEAELGAKLEKQFDNAKVYVKPSVIRTFTNGDSVVISGMNKASTYKDQTLGRVEIGGRYGFTDALSAYAWANYTFGSSYDAYALGAGLNYAW